MRVAFAGTPEFALPALHALARSQHEIVGVLTQPDRPRGRGRHPEPSPVKLAALDYEARLAQPDTGRSESMRDELAAWRPDVLVVAAYGLILPPAVLQLPRLGCLNIHASLLPRWRGAAPIQRAILEGDRESGVTIMLMDAGLDTGPMLLQRATPIDGADTAGTLEARLAMLGAEALLETLQRWPDGDLVARPQPSAGVTHAPKIAKAEARIDWRKDAGTLERQVRAFNPRPIAETQCDGEQLRIFRARAVTEGGRPDASVPGTVLASDAAGIEIRCGQGNLLLLEVQRAGRRPIPAREFANSMQLVGRVLGKASPGSA